MFFGPILPKSKMSGKLVRVGVYFFSSLALFLLPFASGAAIFTQVSGNKTVYVGGNVKFLWDYVVDDRNAEFGLISPVWDYYSYVYRNWTEIASEDVRDGWNWTVTLGTFPPTLRNRVTKEGNATLVIKNVESTDAGIYRCTLKLTGDPSISKEAHLSVTTAKATTSSTPTSTPNANITDTTTRTPTPAATTPKQGLSGGEIAGIVVGVILGIIVGAIICCCCYKKCTKKRRPDNVPPDKKQENEMNPSA